MFPTAYVEVKIIRTTSVGTNSYGMQIHGCSNARVGSRIRLHCYFSPRVYSRLLIYYYVFMIMISSRKAHSSIDCDRPASLESLAGNTIWAKRRLSITHTWNERSRFQSTFIPQGHPVCARAAMGEPHNFAASISRRGSTGRARQGVHGSRNPLDLRPIRERSWLARIQDIARAYRTSGVWPPSSIFPKTFAPGASNAMRARLYLIMIINLTPIHF